MIDIKNTIVFLLSCFLKDPIIICVADEEIPYKEKQESQQRAASVAFERR